MDTAKFKKVIIAGSRHFCTHDDYLHLQTEMDQLILTLGLPDEIVSGGAKGADSLGERYATENQIAITRFVPDWDKLGKRAGFARNVDMGNYADTVVAFWDGQSRGTRHMIEFAIRKGLEVVLIMVPNKNNNGSGTLYVS